MKNFIQKYLVYLGAIVSLFALALFLTGFYHYFNIPETKAERISRLSTTQTSHTTAKYHTSMYPDDAKHASSNITIQDESTSLQTPAADTTSFADTQDSTNLTKAIASDNVCYIETSIGDSIQIVLPNMKEATESQESEVQESMESEASSLYPVGPFKVKSDVSLLNIRKEPSRDAAIVAKLTNFSRGTVLSNDGTWAHIETKHYEGYVAVEFLEIQEEER